MHIENLNKCELERSDILFFIFLKQTYEWSKVSKHGNNKTINSHAKSFLHLQLAFWLGIDGTIIILNQQLNSLFELEHSC